MNSIAAVVERPGLGSVSHSYCRWMAAQTLRRLAHQTPYCVEDGLGALPPCDDTVRAGDALRTFLIAASPDRGSRTPCISLPGRPALTKDEWRLLRAIGAVQANNEELLDNYLYRIALNRQQRTCLADAIRALTKALAARGYVLSVPLTPDIPAPSLCVAGMHGLALVAGLPSSAVRAETAMAPLVLVEVTPPVRQLVAPDVPLTRTVRARIQTDVGFRTTGRVVKRAFEVGQHITANQVLATLEPVERQADVGNNQAVLRSAQAQLMQAQLTYDRQQQLIASGFTTWASYDAAYAALNTAQEQFSYTELRAGQDGYVVSRSIESGQVVQAGQAALVLAVDEPRDAVFEVPETLLTTPPPDRTVDIALQSDPAVRAEGTVRDISPILNPATNTVTAKVMIADTPAAMTLGSAA